MKEAKRYLKIYYCFLRKSLIWGNLIFLPHTLLLDRVRSNLSQGAVTIESSNSQDMISFMVPTGSLNSWDMNRIHRQSRNDFSGKHLCDGYCMDIIWSLCMKVNIQQRVEYFSEKASLKIYFIILFECKGPWMLRTDGN